MIKRIIALTITVAFILAQGTAYAGYGRDVRRGPYTGEADLSTGTAAARFAISIRNLSDSTTATKISWSNVGLGDDWKKADQYLRIRYFGNQRKWGIQIFTDNMGTVLTANPQYDGDPTRYINQQPGGLLGVDRPRLTCPIAILTTRRKISSPDTNLKVPNEVTSGTPGTPDYVVYFDNGYDEVAEPQGVPVRYEKVWYWLKDLSSTKWDADSDNDGVADPSEIVSTFTYPGIDDYATIVNSLGIASGWVDPVTDTMIRDPDLGNQDANSNYPIQVYFAAKFKLARELQIYKTNTITLELYHETP